MSSMEINRVLEQIRSLQSQSKIGQVGQATQANQTQQTTGVSEFANIMRQGLNAVSQTEQRANQLTEAFERGTPGVELPQVMLEVSKASVSLRAASEVRNRLISAYQDIMNMQL
jgi:flagellar hook-basal body complex protein FliE